VVFIHQETICVLYKDAKKALLSQTAERSSDKTIKGFQVSRVFTEFLLTPADNEDLVEIVVLLGLVASATAIVNLNTDQARRIQSL